MYSTEILRYFFHFSFHAALFFHYLYIYMKEIMEDHIFSLLLHLIPEKKDFKNQGGIKPMQKRQ